MIINLSQMKRKKQIEYFLKNRRYRTRIDFDLVSSYCRTKFGLKLHEPSYFENDSGMTSAIFQNGWKMVLVVEM